MHNIRGTRYDIELAKEVKGIPGFAPENREVEVGKVCVKYLDGEEPFLQFFGEPPILEIEDVKEILELLERGYIQEDFINLK